MCLLAASLDTVLAMIMCESTERYHNRQDRRVIEGEEICIEEVLDRNLPAAVAGTVVVLPSADRARYPCSSNLALMFFLLLANSSKTHLW